MLCRHTFTLLRGLSQLQHCISQLFHHQHIAQPFTLYCLCFSSLFASTTQQFLLEKRSSLAPGSGFHSKILVLSCLVLSILWAHRPQHLHVPEQSHQLCASPRGTMPKARAGRELGSVLQKLKDTFTLVLWFLLHSMQQRNLAGVGWPICLVAMTMCYTAQNVALSSLDAWLLWADNTLQK